MSSKHEWEYFDYDSKARCTRCGTVASHRMARWTGGKCVGALVNQLAPEPPSDVIERAVMKIPVRTGPLTQAELDRAADACKPDGTDWQGWRLGYEAPRGIVEVIDCFGKHHGPGPAFLYEFEGKVVWYRIREDLGVSDVQCRASDAADAMAYTVPAHVPDKSLTEPLPKATDADISTVAGKVGEVSFYENIRIIEREIDKVCGLPAFAEVEKGREDFAKRGVGALPAAPRNHVSDAAWQLVRQWDPSGTSVMVERIEKLGCHLITCAEYDALTASLAMLDKAQRHAIECGRVAIDANTELAALRAKLDALQSGEAAGQIEHLDRENARLRRELAAMKASRDGWRDQAGVWVSTAAELRRSLHPDDSSSANVTRIEPFPDVDPYDGDWIPPAHRPRIAP